MDEKKRPAPIKKKDLLAKLELASKGINPIDMLKEVYDLAISSFRNGRGHGSEYDAGPQYLGVAYQTAKRLSEFYSPTIAPLKAEDIPDMDEKTIEAYTPMDAKRIREVILADPFARSELVQQENVQGPLLEAGKANDPLTPRD